MQYSVTFLEEHHRDLTSHLLSQRPAEGAAVLICGLSESTDETRLLVREVIPVSLDDVLESSPIHMKIAARPFLRAMKKANAAEACFVFVHSHPPSMPGHSQRDDQEEEALFRTAYNRIHCSAVHASIVYSDVEKPVGRVWLESGQTAPVRVIRVVGDRFRLFYAPTADDGTIADLARYDRQVRAFGPEMQTLLSRMNVGVVGSGGTGSCVIEQLIRLGVGTLTIADGQCFEGSNVTRVYGSRASDTGTAKTSIMGRLGSDIGMGTRIILVARPITFQSVLKQLRDCDVVFGCTDDQWGRSLLTRLSIYYYVPVFDMGVKIDSDCGKIRSVQGRVTTLMPGTACLFCRRRISPEVIAAETKEALDPSGAAELRREGYAPELRGVVPAVITFTTAIAASAVSEFLHRLTGFMGTERRSSEVVHLFDKGNVRANNAAAAPACFCAGRENWGRGDRPNFLDVTWRPE
jgi:molybdopterin/thiamine biosynthesis adenylyltransferase